MSYYSLCIHRCDFYALTPYDNDGMTGAEWTKVNTSPVRCRLDLNYLRGSRDLLWVEAANKPTDRAGTLFLLPDAPVQSGVRVVMTKGPKGTFTIQGSIDEAWGREKVDHLEVGVLETSPLEARGTFTS